LTRWEGIPALTQGRIYGVFDAKPPQFEKWYERIVRYIRKNGRKNPISWMGGCVGPAARRGELWVLIGRFEDPSLLGM
jgi:hypothetical protein